MSRRTLAAALATAATGLLLAASSAAADPHETCVGNYDDGICVSISETIGEIRLPPVGTILRNG